ncbi:MAG: nitroreductase family protein [Acidobacteriota bacterium]|nr:nitroreductase family protein [Acidobacteriota bacterium]MDQ7088365.1 nitroreductase family protein [Acidobacteriota bacterium]
MNDGPPMVDYRPPHFPPDEMERRAREYYEHCRRRRSVRAFAPDPVPRRLIELAIATAGTAPSGAHMQPWTFVAVSDPALKRRIRLAAEEEERRSYEGGRMPPAWKEALRPLGTDAHKPYLETVPWLVVAFEQVWREGEDGRRLKNYYVRESVGLACGLFIAAIHRMGLATLTHTPSPMGFLRTILGRPENERAIILFPVGYPAPDCRVPDIQRKSLDEIAVWLEG